MGYVDADEKIPWETTKSVCSLNHTLLFYSYEAELPPHGSGLLCLHLNSPLTPY